MSVSYSIERDLEELEKMGDAIKKYLPGDELYMSVSGGFFGASNFPQLTMGAFLMRARRLSHFREKLDIRQQAILDHALDQYHEARTEWTVHYEKKLNREVQSRLKSMNEFFRECRDSIKACDSAYPVEAMRRTIVQEIVIEMKQQGLDTHEAITACHKTDGELRRWVTAGDFIWSENLKAVYPRDSFWWLYGRPDAGDV